MGQSPNPCLPPNKAHQNWLRLRLRDSVTLDDCLDLTTASADLLSPSLHPTWPVLPHISGDDNEWPLEVLPSPLNDAGHSEDGTPGPQAVATPGFKIRNIGQHNQENIPLLGHEGGDHHQGVLISKHAQDQKAFGISQVQQSTGLPTFSSRNALRNAKRAFDPRRQSLAIQKIFDDATADEGLLDSEDVLQLTHRSANVGATIKEEEADLHLDPSARQVDESADENHDGDLCGEARADAATSEQPLLDDEPSKLKRHGLKPQRRHRNPVRESMALFLELEASVSSTDQGEQALSHGRPGALASVMEGDEETADAQDISISPAHCKPSPGPALMQEPSPSLASPGPVLIQETSPTLASPGTHMSPLIAQLSPPQDESFLAAEQCASPTRAVQVEAGLGAPPCVSEPGFGPSASARRTPRRLVLDRTETGCSKSVAELVVHFSPKPAATPKPTPKHCITPKRHAKSLFWEEITAQEAEKALASPSKSSPLKSSPLKAYPTVSSPGSRGGPGIGMASPSPTGVDGCAMGSPTSRGLGGSVSVSASSNPLTGAIWAVRELAAAPLPTGHRFDSQPTSSPVKSSPFLLTSSLASPIFPKSPGAFGSPRVSTPTLNASMPLAHVQKEPPKSPLADAPTHMTKDAPKSPLTDVSVQQNSPKPCARTPMQSLSQSYPNPVVPICAMDDCAASGTPSAGRGVGAVTQGHTMHCRLDHGRTAPDETRRPCPDLGAAAENGLPVEMGHSREERTGTALRDNRGTPRMSRVPQPRMAETLESPNLQRQEDHSRGPALTRPKGEALVNAGAATSAGARSVASGSRLVLPGEMAVLPDGVSSPTNSSWIARTPLPPQGSQPAPRKLAEAGQQLPKIGTASASLAVGLQQSRNAVPAEAPSLLAQNGSRLGPSGGTAEGGAVNSCTAEGGAANDCAAEGGVEKGDTGGKAEEGAEKGGAEAVGAPLRNLRAPSRLKRPTASSGFFGPGRRTSRLSISTAKGHEDLPLSKQTKPESSATHIPHPPPALPPSIPAPPAPAPQPATSRSAEGPPLATCKPAVPGWKRGSRLAAAPARSASYQNPGPRTSGNSGNVVKSQDLAFHKSTASEQLQGSQDFAFQKLTASGQLQGNRDLNAHAGQGPLAAGKPAQEMQLRRSQESNLAPVHGALEADASGRSTYSKQAWQSQEVEGSKPQAREGPKGEGGWDSGVGESVERVQRAGHRVPLSKGGSKSEVARALTPELDPRVAALLNDPEAAFVARGGGVMNSPLDAKKEVTTTITATDRHYMDGGWDGVPLG